MAEKMRNLCAEIPLELHTKVRQRQAESGETLSRYMTALITKYYEMEENVKMDKDNVRTVAFQVPTELFEQLRHTSSGMASSRMPSSWTASGRRWRRTPALPKNKKYIA